ncbi:heterogeneous nuclear ribonucleoprotein U-like protein 1 isoform X2 [Liolophura sinensis]|uniref:heterogeneous nuclear ribonucleoprotein U-like protein 1 isoform X2 n=1 Tax=Liolophura sinensis TaxID=3198878 RepID=UPI0031591D30
MEPLGMQKLKIVKSKRVKSKRVKSKRRWRNLSWKKTESTEHESAGENGAKAESAGEQATEEDDDGLPEEFQTIDETNDEDGDEKKEEKERERRPSKRARSRSRSPRRRSRERSRRSRSRERRRESPKVVVEEEDDSWLQSTAGQLDRYHADLNLRIDENGLKAHPLTAEGFAFMWAGARGMFGVTSGKVAFEVKIAENIKVEHLPSEETKNVVRVGWSVDSTTTQLGEEPLSYGYGGTAKASENCKFKDYGETFTSGDVITAYLDLDSEPATIAYSKNGEYQDVCFEVDKETLGEKALFPHILTKNTEFEVNFGALETPWFPLQEEFVFIDQVEAEKRVRGTEPPAKKEECEIIMMVGLPGAGKTYWAQKHSAANPEKRFNVLGTNNIIDKMKVMGLPRKKNYAGRWDSLIEKSTRCLNRLIEISARKRRNYILDQTNVYASARRRKMQPFEGFQRKAVVVIPSDEDFKTRIAEREKEEGKEVPERAVLEMKANFTLPEVGSLFDTVEFTELNQEEGGKLVEKYMKEAKAALPPPEKRFRGDRFSPRGRSDYRGDHRGRGGYHGDRYGDRYGGRGGYRGGYKDGGYRDNHRGYGSRGSYNRYDSSGRYDNRNRYDNRSGGSHSRNLDNRSYDSRSSGSHGSWGGRQGSWGGSGHSGSWNNQSGWGGQGHWGSSQGGYGSYNQGYGSQSNQGYGGQWGNSWNQNYWGGQGGSGYNQGSGYNSGSGSQWYGSYK